MAKSIMTEIINNRIGKVFSETAVFVAYVFLILGVICCFSHILLGLVLIAGSAFVCFTAIGIQIDIKGKKYKEYTSIVNFKIGGWKPLDEYINIAILTSRQSYSTYSRANLSITNTDIYYDTFLLNQSHIQKLRVNRHKNKETAIADAKSLSNHLGFPFVEFSPEISERTMARR